jgi:hypothetical protein
MSDNQKTPACNNHEDLVSYLYGEASAEQTSRVESHLAGCSRCDDELTAFRRVRSALQEWELNDMPIVRVALPPQRRSAAAVLKELFGIAPIWAKAFSVVAAAMLVLAVMGTDVRIGHDGFHFETALFGSRRQVVDPPPVNPAATGEQGMTRDEVKLFVNQQILDSERAQKGAMSLELARLETALKNTHTNDFAKLAVRVQEQRDQIRTLQHDIDRREGLDYQDILFSSNGADRSRRSAVDAEGGQ